MLNYDYNIMASRLQKEVPLHIFVYALLYALRRKPGEVLLYVITTGTYTVKHTSQD